MGTFNGLKEQEFVQLRTLKKRPGESPFGTDF